MNKKFMLGLGAIAAAALPVSAVVACGSKEADNKGGDTTAAKKTAVVTVDSPGTVAATVAGADNAYTLEVTKADTAATKDDLGAALKDMVAKATDDEATVEFSGSWDIDFDVTADGTYAYTVSAEGYDGVTFTVTVTGNTVAKKTAVVTVTSPADVAATVVKANDNAYTLAFANTDTATKGALETALTGMVAIEDGDTEAFAPTGKWDTDFDGTKNATYTFTVKATGYNDVTFAVTVTGNTIAKKTAVVTVASPADVAATVVKANDNEYTLAVLNTDTATKGALETALIGMVAVEDGDTEAFAPTGKWDTDFDGTKNATYTFTVKATGYNDVTFAVKVTGNTVAKKTAVVTVASPADVAATVAGSGNAYTLAFANTDTATKGALETALTGMVASASGDNSTSFAGTWDTDFDRTKNATYTFTVKATGYNDVTFAVKVTGNKKTVKMTDVTTTDLVTGSFEVTGANGSGAIAKKAGASLPSQVEVQFAKIDGQKIGSYAKTLNGLSNNDQVSIKFMVKTADQATYQIPTSFTNPITLTVNGLITPKADVTTTDLVTGSFEVTGADGSGAIAKKAGVSLPSQVEVQFAKIDGQTPLSYAKTLNGLSNSDKVSIKFMVKTADQATYQIPTSFTNPITLTVNGLITPKADVTTTDLVKGSFEVTGANGSGAIAKKAGASLPSQVEVQFAKIDGQTPLSYAKTLNGLSNNDQVSIKFMVKTADQATYQIPTSFTNPITLTVNGLITPKADVTTTDLVTGSFEVTGADGSGAIALSTGKTLPAEVKATYWVDSKGTAKNDESATYAATAPTNLSNTDVVYIKFGIKQANQATHQIPTSFTNPIKLTVTGLQTPIAKKTAVVTVASPADVAATVVKANDNEYTLAVLNTDKAEKEALETALTGMVASASGDNSTSFAGTWDTDFDGTKNATYTFTVKATGYNDVTFAVKVTGNTTA